MIKRYIIGILGIMMMSCSGFLEEYSQDKSYVHSYTDLDELLIGGGYMESDFNDYSFEGYCPYIHFMADEAQENIQPKFSLEYSSPRDRYFGYYTWQKQVNRGFDNLETGVEDGDWNRLYEHINIANMVIQEIDNQSGDSEFDKKSINRIRGEAYFLRGAYYFLLVNLYGKPYTEANSLTDPGVPLKLTEYIEDNKYTRNSVQEVYDQVIDDLGEAEKNLQDVERKSVFRADITATYLLFSRVYLYMRNWEKAKYYAGKVLEKNDKLIDLNSYQNTGDERFLNSKSVETIFSMGANWLCFSENMGVKQKGMSASEDLKKAYTSHDLRASIFLDQGPDEDPYIIYWPCKKYASYGTGTDVSDTYIFRTAEAYLNLAEACAYLADESGARKALNALRRHRLDQNEEITFSGKKLVEEIRDERFRELCFEGHRWFDLRRYTVCDRYPLQKVLRNTYSTFDADDYPLQTYVYELQPGDPAYTLPIPREVLQFDDLITNNPRDDRGVAETIRYN